MLITKENTLIFGEGPTQGLDDTTLTVEAMYPIKEKICIKSTPQWKQHFVNTIKTY